jgi:biopolymer transport protein ExbD
MSAWLVRQEGTTKTYALPTEGAVMAALRDGNFVPADEVKGPGDPDWRPFDSHPAFAETALDLEPEPEAAEDDTHLDMNPLIDVCLVLLIFFILTITYATLERALSVPEDTAEDKAAQKVEMKDIKDRVFLVIVKMDGEKPVIKIGPQGALKDVPHDKEKIFKEIETIMTTTGRREMVLDIERDVPWGVETDILDAAKGNKIHDIINNQRPRPGR